MKTTLPHSVLFPLVNAELVPMVYSSGLLFSAPAIFLAKLLCRLVDLSARLHRIRRDICMMLKKNICFLCFDDIKEQFLG